ncbi:hypothetical protein B0H17DRAFT_963746 [Mycena rosella]|uniref:Uncharacterized protein n=1 Tax=Mycena rosella TaxID=1033263 RepID=A0AAD7FKH1_MYCRO|nr:hypothetical protein B0H17DRAFT_963746 [Mycena rosella]
MQDVSVSVEVCEDTDGGCVTLPIVSDKCINLTGGLSFLNKAVSSAVVPGGFICTFFEDFECAASEGADGEVVLQRGTWNFFSVPGTSGTVDFNDLTSSFACSPL